MCKVLKISRSSYYNHLNKVKSKSKLRKEFIQDKILEIYYDSKKIYGAPKIHKILSGLGIKINIKTVQRYMVELGIRSIVIKNYKPYTKKTNIIERENILDRDFETDKINQKWCADITYIHTQKNGWTYLASVMDLHSRKIVGYSYGKKMTSDLVLDSIKNAEINRKKDSKIILHSYLGSQYTSDLITKYCKKNNILQSFSRKGNPYDNACIESFHSILKKEEVNYKTYKSYEEAKLCIFMFIEHWYNNKRIHSSINYRTPNEIHNAS